MDTSEQPIAAIDAQKTAYKQTKAGISITFTIHPDDEHKKLMELPLGEVVRLYVTKPSIGA